MNITLSSGVCEKSSFGVESSTTLILCQICGYFACGDRLDKLNVNPFSFGQNTIEFIREFRDFMIYELFI